MRKLISVITVSVIVSSSLAFKAKPLNGIFCGSLIQNINCHIIPNQREVSGGTANTFINASWDGTATGCVATQCPTPTRLVGQD